MDKNAKLYGCLDDPVVGPVNLDTEEQARTRSQRQFEERPEDRLGRTDPHRSTLEKNVYGHAGVDDRGTEEHPR